MEVQTIIWRYCILQRTKKKMTFFLFFHLDKKRQLSEILLYSVLVEWVSPVSASDIPKEEYWPFFQAGYSPDVRTRSTMYCVWLDSSNVEVRSERKISLHTYCDIWCCQSTHRNHKSVTKNNVLRSPVIIFWVKSALRSVFKYFNTIQLVFLFSSW